MSKDFTISLSNTAISDSLMTIAAISVKSVLLISTLSRPNKEPK